MARRRKKKRDSKAEKVASRRAESTRRIAEWPDEIWENINRMKRKRGEPEGLRNKALAGLTRPTDIKHPHWNGGDR